MCNRLLFFIVIFLFSLNLFSQKSIFWEVTSPDNKIKSYLLGTFHTLGNHFLDSIPTIKEKLYNTELAIFECVDGDKTKFDEIVLKRKSRYDYLEELDSNYIDKIDSLLNGWEIPLAKLKPAELIVKLQNLYTISHCNNVMPNDSLDHLDNYLQYLAEQNKIEIFGLESNSDQVKLFKKTLPKRKWAEVSSYLYSLTDEVINKNDSSNCSVVKQYRQLVEYYDFSLECNNFLKTKTRNDKWMKIIPRKLKMKSCFIAVGLAHLRRDCGLISQLRALDFQVEPVYLK